MEHKVAVIVFSDSETHADMARIANAMQIIREFTDAGDEARLLFDGAGVTWPPKLSAKGHPLNPLFEKIKSFVGGACMYCSRAFKVAEEVEKSGIMLLGDYKGHPSVRNLIQEGYQVITL